MIFSWDAVDWNTAMVFGMMVGFAFLLVLGCAFSGWKKGNGKKLLKAVSPIFGGYIVLSALALCVEAHGPWRVADKGIFDFVDYRQVDEHHLVVFGGTRAVTVTVIHWDDGRTFEISHPENMSFPKGTCIIVLTK